MTNPTPTIVPIYRFNEEQLRHLENTLPKIGLNGATTPLQAGYLLGIQQVLKVLRDGYTVA